MTTLLAEQQAVSPEQRAAFIDAGWQLRPHPAGGGWYADHPELGQVPMYDSVARVMEAALERSAQPDLPPGGSPEASATIGPDHRFARPATISERGEATISAIVPGRWQPRRRFDEARLQELADSIKEHGVLTALKVFCNELGQFELIAGERRWRAAQLAGLKRVPIEVAEMTARQIQEIAIIDNLQREDLQPDEEGEAFELAISQLGVSEAELARRLGVGRTYIQQRRALVGAVPALREAVVAGELTVSQARGIIAGAGGDMAAEAKAVEWVLERAEDGKAVSEVEAKQHAAGAILSCHRMTLGELGWVTRHCWIGGSTARQIEVIYSADEKPRVWTGREILEVVAKRRRPAESAEGKPEAKLSKVITDPLGIMRIQCQAHIAPPWIRVGTDGSNEVEWMSLAELANLAAEKEGEIHRLRQRYQAKGLELVVDNRYFNVCRDGKPTTSSWLGWHEAVSVIEQFESSGLSVEEAFVLRLSTTWEERKRTCLTPDCKGEPNKSERGPHGYGYYCDACLDGYKQQLKDERDSAREMVYEALQGVFDLLDEDPVAMRLACLLLARYDQKREIMDAQVETLRKRFLKQVAKELCDDPLDRAVTWKALGIREDGTQEEQAS